MRIFFRNLRRKLNSNSLVKKYLFYSIGEVLLVMVGILLALQVNNWNEERKLIREGKRYIQDIYQDLSKDRDNLQRIMDRLNEQYNTSAWVLDIHGSPPEDELDTIEYTKNLLMSSFPFVVHRADNTYDDLKSSGKREVVRDDELITLLNEFYFLYDLRISNFNELPKTARYEHRRILSQYQNIDDWRYEIAHQKKSNNYFQTVLKKPELYELLMEIHISSHYNISFFRDLKVNAESILEFIKDRHHNILTTD